MTPALLIKLRLETIRKARLFVLIRDVTPWAWSAGTPTCASVVAFPWSARVSFTNPAAVLAQGAFHRLRCLLARASGSQSNSAGQDETNR
jgi:hypothetical protein